MAGEKVAAGDTPVRARRPGGSPVAGAATADDSTASQGPNTPGDSPTPDGSTAPDGSIAREIAIAAGITAVIAAGTVISGLARDLEPSRLSPVFGWVLILVAGGALCLRRRHPTPVAIITLLAAAVYYPYQSADGPIVLAFLFALYTVATKGHLATAVVLGVASVVAVGYAEVESSTSSGVRHVDDLALFFLAGWIVAAIAVGAVTRNRQAYLREVERRARAAEHGREEEARRRASEERLRIAREVHDIVGHTISLINVQASAALHRFERDPAQTEAALGAIKTSSGDALRELRATLGSLRPDGEAAPTAPTPRLTRLDDLVGGAAAAGLAVRLETAGRPRPVPPEVDVAAYRVVQESLTNVRRHSGARTAFVRVEYAGDDLRVTIDDDGDRGSGPVTAGNGIRGMTERAGGLGGTLRAARRPEGGFRVRAELPLRDVP
jgi:signal transduction histidine kinase